MQLLAEPKGMRFQSNQVRGCQENVVPQCAVVIPAYNEASRIVAVLEAIARCGLVDEIIVVSDGSTDRTAEVAQQSGLCSVLELPENLGKGAAMQAGFNLTSASVVAFFDGDLIGLRTHHVASLVLPILEGRSDATVGVFRGGKFWSDTAQFLAPTLSGQRAMRRTLFETTPMLEEIRMGVEVSLTLHLHRSHARVSRIPLEGISHVSKERKLGFVRGVGARVAMYNDIGRALWRLRRRELRRSGVELYPSIWKSNAR